MPRKSAVVCVNPVELERLIHVVRGQRVMLDTDLGQLYGVPTKVLNQAVRRNRKRFPRDFAYQLTPEEVAGLRSQIVTSNVGRGGQRYRPFAFTEHGVAMLSSVLRSPLAIQVNIEIMRAFVRMRRLLATPGELVAQLNKLQETVELHDDQIKAIAEVLQQLMAPPAESTKQQYGFHRAEQLSNHKTAKEK